MAKQLNLDKISLIKCLTVISRPGANSGPGGFVRWGGRCLFPRCQPTKFGWSRGRSRGGYVVGTWRVRGHGHGGETAGGMKPAVPEAFYKREAEKASGTD